MKIYGYREEDSFDSVNYIIFPQKYLIKILFKKRGGGIILKPNLKTRNYIIERGYILVECVHIYDNTIEKYLSKQDLLKRISNEDTFKLVRFLEEYFIDGNFKRFLRLSESYKGEIEIKQILLQNHGEKLLTLNMIRDRLKYSYRYLGMNIEPYWMVKISTVTSNCEQIYKPAREKYYNSTLIKIEKTIKAILDEIL